MILLTEDVKRTLKSHARIKILFSNFNTKAGHKIPDCDIHDSYYVINVLAISFGLDHIRV